MKPRQLIATTIVPGTGHYPMLEKPAQFAAALDGVLGTLVGA